MIIIFSNPDKANNFSRCGGTSTPTSLPPRWEMLLNRPKTAPKPELSMKETSLRSRTRWRMFSSRANSVSILSRKTGEVDKSNSPWTLTTRIQPARVRSIVNQLPPYFYIFWHKLSASFLFFLPETKSQTGKIIGQKKPAIAGLGCAHTHLYAAQTTPQVLQ